MIKTFEDQELDDFHSWMVDFLPDFPNPKPLPPPSLELFELARKAAQAHQSYLINQGITNSDLQTNTEHLIQHGLAANSAVYTETAYLSAAADSDSENEPITLIYMGGKCSVSVEVDLQNPKNQTLRFRCKEDLIPKFQGYRVQIQIGETIYDLGEVSKRGMAKLDISGDEDFWQSNVKLILPNYPFNTEQE